jgi:shikimate kinase
MPEWVSKIEVFMNTFPSKLALIGYRGVGKSTLGKLLAQEHQLPFKDLDLEIEKKIGSIASYWEHYGEAAFRIQESQTLLDLLPFFPQGILACGGGTVLDTRNTAALKNWGQILWLQLEPPDLELRLQDKKRPPLTSLSLSDDLRETLTQRTPFYKQAATFQIALKGDLPHKDCQRIMQLLSLAPSPS